MKGWIREEKKDSDGFRQWLWRSTVNDDVFVFVRRESIKVVRTPGGLSVTYLSKGTPEYKKYLGYFVSIENRGGSGSFLGGTVRRWNSKLNRYDVFSGSGPWVQEVALKFAYSALERPVPPKSYPVSVPGWRVEKIPFGKRLINNNDGRYQIAITGLGQMMQVVYSIGYGGEKVTIVVDKKIDGYAAAMSFGFGLAKKAGNIPLGPLEKNVRKVFDKVGPLIQKTSDSRLRSINKLVKDGAIAPSDAVKLLGDKK